MSSAICAIAPNTSALVVARVLQGVGAALLTPGSLAIIESAFEPSDRGRAIGAWSGLGGVASAAGPLLGGYLITAASWRWIFVINLPLGAIVLLLSVRHVPESRDATATGGVDLAGAALAVLALASITYGLIEGPTKGWSGHVVDGALLLGALATVGFLAVEQRSSNPMVPLEVFRIRQFSVTNAVTFFVYAALGGALFLLPIELQVVDHYTPLESGCALLPITVIMLLLSARSGQLASRIGPRLQMSIGPVVVGAGLALLARATTDAFVRDGRVAGRRGVRSRSRNHGRSTDDDRTQCATQRPRGHGLCTEQRRRPHGESDRRARCSRRFPGSPASPISTRPRSQPAFARPSSLPARGA